MPLEKQATYDDVTLILRLYELRREERMRRARAWFAQSFRARDMQELTTLCPQGSEENASFRMVLSYWDMVASFITSGVLHQELFFQSGSELLMVWEKTKNLMGPFREMIKNPNVAKNLETVAANYREWLNRAHPEAYGTFAARVEAMAAPSQDR